MVVLVPHCSLLLSSRLSKPDVGAQEPDAIVDDDPYYTMGAYYYVQAADDQE